MDETRQTPRGLDTKNILTKGRTIFHRDIINPQQVILRDAASRTHNACNRCNKSQQVPTVLLCSIGVLQGRKEYAFAPNIHHPAD